MSYRLKKIWLAVSFALMSTVFLAFKSDFFEVAKQMEIYTTLFKELNMYYIDEINPAQLTETAIDYMLNDLDPYTKFYDEQGVEEVKINSSGEYSGIGAESRFFDNRLFISEVYEGYSAEKQGIKPGDEIIAIDDIKVAEYDGEQILSLLKGAPGSEVNMVINRMNKILNFEVKREKIIVDPVPHYQMVTEDIGYIAFNKFNNKATSSVKNAFVELKEKGMNKLIFDVRGNPGGLLNEAIDITNFFIPKNEVVVSTKAKLKKWSEVYRTKHEPIDLEIPMVILIDDKSASAAEIVAGSLQDLDRAIILGKRSFGKGLVQRYRNLSYGTKLKLTISKYYTPSGRNIQELDYAHRKGKDVPKFSKGQRNSFLTRNGRTVYDGGGIEPDIHVDGEVINESTDALLKSNAIFHYASQFYYANESIKGPEEFVLNEGQYEEFIDFLKQGNTNFRTDAEKQFKKAYEKAEKEGLSFGIETAYDELLTQLEDQKLEEINKNKGTIKHIISDEIINRYYYKKGEYQNHIVYSPFIKEAVKILQDEDRYNSILKK